MIAFAGRDASLPIRYAALLQLDKRPNGSSINIMKAPWKIAVTVLALSTVSLSAQQKGLVTASRDGDSDTVQSNNKISALPAQEPQSTSSDMRLGKKLRASGPLIHVIKSEKVSEAPRRALQLVNPFAPVEKVEPLEKTRDLNPRAWSTTVGLRPGTSAFADVRTHEPTMSLVTVGR